MQRIAFINLKFKSNLNAVSMRQESWYFMIYTVYSTKIILYLCRYNAAVINVAIYVKAIS